VENIVHQPAVLEQQVDIAVPDTVPVVAPKSASRGSKQVSSVLTANTRRDKNKIIERLHMSCHQKNYYRLFIMRFAILWIGVNIVMTRCIFVSTNTFIMIENDDTAVECYRAVTEGVPKNFTAALQHPVWGEPACKEFETVTHGSGAIIEGDQSIARENVRNGAEVQYYVCLTHCHEHSIVPYQMAYLTHNIPFYHLHESGLQSPQNSHYY
jgi:hypothetical protein